MLCKPSFHKIERALKIDLMKFKFLLGERSAIYHWPEQFLIDVETDALAEVGMVPIKVLIDERSRYDVFGIQVIGSLARNGEIPQDGMTLKKFELYSGLFLGFNHCWNNLSRVDLFKFL